MKITERKEVTHVNVDEVIVGRNCDICGKGIYPSKDWDARCNYFVIHTWHNDWGNDSIESHEYFDACCPDCVMKFTQKYIKDSFEGMTHNTMKIEIAHARTLAEGACDY